MGEDTRAPRDGVILLHGFAGWPGRMARLERDCVAAGWATLSPYYPSWARPHPHNLARLQARIAHFADEVPGKVHFVGHSMGGLMIRALLNQWRPARMGQVVMIGTPQGGSELADIARRIGLAIILGHSGALLTTARDATTQARLGTVDYPLGIIAGDRHGIMTPLRRLIPAPHDGKVSVAATHIAGESAHIVLPVSHDRMPAHRHVRAQVIAFLHNGSFTDGRHA